MSVLVCGLDVHKDSTYATILDSHGKIVNQTRMNNERVLPYLSHFRVRRVGMESSNQIAPLYRKLAYNGYSVVVSHPKKTRYIAEAKIKCDRVDSRAIAELVRLDALPLAYFPDEETATLREKVRRRAFLVRSRVKLRVKIKSVLTYEGLKWPSDQGLFTRKGVEWLQRLNLQPVESYLRIMKPLDDEIMLLSKELRRMASGTDMTYEIAQAMKVNVTYGWLIAQVTTGGAAQKAGLRGGTTQTQIEGSEVTIGGDIITAINSTRIRNLDDLSTYLEEYTLPGQTIEVTIMRGNQTLTLPIELQARPAST